MSALGFLSHRRGVDSAFDHFLETAMMIVEDREPDRIRFAAPARMLEGKQSRRSPASLVSSFALALVATAVIAPPFRWCTVLARLGRV